MHTQRRNTDELFPAVPVFQDEALTKLIDETMAARNAALRQPVEEWEQRPKITVVLKQRTLAPPFMVLGIALIIGASIATYVLFLAPRDMTIMIIPKSQHTTQASTLTLNT